MGSVPGTASRQVPRTTTRESGAGSVGSSSRVLRSGSTKRQRRLTGLSANRLRRFSVLNVVNNCPDCVGRYPLGMTAKSNSEAEPARFSGKEDEPLAAEATHILRMEMHVRRISYKELAEAMSRLTDGPTESAQALTNKVNRGRFSFAFFLRACRAMGVTRIEIPEAPIEPKRRR